MKSIFLITSSLFILTMATTTSNAQTSGTNDDSQIREAVKNLEEGWNKKDGNLYAKSFAENADYVVVNGNHIKGKKGIAIGHQTIFDTFYKETMIKTEVQSIRYIRPDIAIVHVKGHMSGKSNGREVDTNAIITLTVEKTPVSWQIDAFQNTGVQDQPAKPTN